MDIYSKEIDEKVRKQVDEEFEKNSPFKNKQKDWLTADPSNMIPKKQEYFCISFAPPDKRKLEEAEIMTLSYFLVNCMDRKELIDILSKNLDKNEEDPMEKRKNTENIYMEFLSRYIYYKRSNQVLLQNVLKEHFGKRIYPDGIIKFRGAYRSMKKAQTIGEKLGKLEGIRVFCGESGKWFPVLPNKFDVDEYSSDDKELNEMIRKHKEEIAKASRSDGLRRELLMRQGKKIAEDLKKKNEEDIKAGKYDNTDPEMPQLNPNKPKDVNLTEIDDWKENPDTEKPEVEIDLLAVKPPKGKSKIKNIMDEFEKKAQDEADPNVNTVAKVSASSTAKTKKKKKRKEVINV